jgi:hypothetical protein
MPHHLVLQNGMELLEFTQGDDRGSLVVYVQDFNCMLVPFKDEYVQKLIFLHGLKPWVQKIIYQRTNIPETYQRLMKMVECVEDETPTCPKGEIGSGVTQKNQADPNNGSKGRTKRKWG